MTFRHPVLTLRKMNPEIYGSSITFLKEFIKYNDGYKSRIRRHENFLKKVQYLQQYRF